MCTYKHEFMENHFTQGITISFYHYFYVQIVSNQLTVMPSNQLPHPSGCIIYFFITSFLNEIKCTALESVIPSKGFGFYYQRMIFRNQDLSGRQVHCYQAKKIVKKQRAFQTLHTPPYPFVCK